MAAPVAPVLGSVRRARPPPSSRRRAKRAVLRPILWWLCRPEVTADTNLSIPRYQFFTKDYVEFRDRERTQRRQLANGRAFSEREEPFREIRAAIEQFLGAPLEQTDPHRLPVLAPWTAARASLHHDADAPLPRV